MKLIYLLLACALIAGCGDDGGTTTNSYNDITIITTETVNNVDGSKTITFTYTDGSTRTVLVLPDGTVIPVVPAT